MSRVYWFVALGSIAVVVMLFVGGVHCSQPGGVASSALGDAGCAPTRYIVSDFELGAGGMPCSDRPGDGGVWTGSILFSAAETQGRTSQDASDWYALPEGLRGYCAYTWSGIAPPDLSKVVVGKELASPDLPVVSPIDSFTATGCGSISSQSATADCAVLWETAQMAADVPGANPGRGFIDIVLVDTTPTGRTANLAANSPHGNAVGSVAQEVACSGADCTVGVTYLLGMPRKECGTDYDAGGEFGTLGEVAVAVWAGASLTFPASVTSFPAPPPPERRPLVINLSLGWVPIEDSGVLYPVGQAPTPTSGDAGTPIDPGESAVLAALSYANCQGALILAAAGNKASATSSEMGPLRPAAWEAIAAPTDCTAFKDASAPGSPDASNAPLLYAVGGVDFEDRPLANARPGAHPRLAAYGAGVTVPLQASTPVYSPIMTGSSMATAMASGVAAATWSAMPGASPADVMALVYDAGVPLDAAADFPASSPSQTIHRLSLCRALAQACEGQSCTVPACETTRIAPPISVASLSFPAVTATPSDVAQLRSPGNAIDEPWGFPQPNGEGCSFCVMSLDRNGNLVLDAVLAAPLTTPAVVVLTDSSGNQTAFSLGMGDDGGVAVGGGEDDAGPTAFQVTFNGMAMPAGATLSLVSVGTYDPIFLTAPSTP